VFDRPQMWQPRLGGAVDFAIAEHQQALILAFLRRSSLIRPSRSHFRIWQGGRPGGALEALAEVEGNPLPARPSFSRLIGALKYFILVNGKNC